MEYYLIAFNSTSNAIAAQKLLLRLEPVVMPTLREITAGCGMSLRLKPEMAEEAKKLLSGSLLTGWRIYRVLSDKGHNICQPVT